MNDERSWWDSSPMQIVRWLILLPTGCGLLILAEVIVNLIVILFLSIDSLVVLVIVLFLGGGITLTLIGMVATFATFATTFIAPNMRIGIVLVGTVYALLQLTAGAFLLADGMWLNILVKVAVMGFAFYAFVQWYIDEDKEQE